MCVFVYPMCQTMELCVRLDSPKIVITIFLVPYALPETCHSPIKKWNLFPTLWSWESLWLLQLTEYRGSDHRWLLSLGHKKKKKKKTPQVHLAFSLFLKPSHHAERKAHRNLKSPWRAVLTDCSNPVSPPSQQPALTDQQVCWVSLPWDDSSPQPLSILREKNIGHCPFWQWPIFWNDFALSH